MHRLFLIVFLTLGVVSSVVASPVQFSATAVKISPEGETITSKLYVGDGVVRTESSHEGQTRISIVDSKRRIAWLFNPEKKEYVERVGSSTGEQARPSQAPLPDDPGSPCQTEQGGLTCNKLGIESIGGRPTEKWEFITTRQGQSMRAVFWFDRKLRMPIRREFPGGYVGELRDIKEGPQPAHLFTVPQGYTKLDLPTQQPAGTESRGGNPRYSVPSNPQ